MNKHISFVILDKAKEDMFLISEHISRDNKKAASNLLKQFYSTFETLARYPELGCKRSDFTQRDVKFYVVKKKFLILYNVQKQSIAIMRVFSTYEDICQILRKTL